MSALPIALGIGAASSLLGGLFGSSGASKQAAAELQSGREARAFAQDQYGRGQLGQLAAYYGSSAPDIAKAFLSREQYDQLVGVPAKAANFSPEEQRRVAEIQAKLKLPTATTSRNPFTRAVAASRGGQTVTAQERAALQAELDALMAKSGGSPGKAGSMDTEAIKALGPGLIAQYSDLAKSQQGINARSLAEYDQGTSRLGSLARNIETMAAKYGKGREQTIRQDSQESLDNSNRLATASLMSRGMGASTALTDAYRGNARTNQRETQSALADLGDRQIGLQTGLAGQRLGLISGRQSGREALQSGQQNQNLSMQQGVLNLKNQSLTGSVMNPWLGQNVTSYFPSASPSGAAQSTLGGALGGLGSVGLGYGLMGLLSGGGAGGGVNTGLNQLGGNPFAMYGNMQPG